MWLNVSAKCVVSLRKRMDTHSTVAVCRYRVAKIHRMSYLYSLFSAKEPYNYWLFGKK